MNLRLHSSPTKLWPVCRQPTHQHSAHPLLSHTFIGLSSSLMAGLQQSRIHTSQNYNYSQFTGLPQGILCPCFGGVLLSSQCHLLQTISCEVPVSQIYSKQFSQYCKKLGHKLCSSFKPVPGELSLQKAE